MGKESPESMNPSNIGVTRCKMCGSDLKVGEIVPLERPWLPGAKTVLNIRSTEEAKETCPRTKDGLHVQVANT